MRTCCISEMSNPNELNFGLVWILYGPNICINFQRNLRGCKFFSVWNDLHISKHVCLFVNCALIQSSDSASDFSLLIMEWPTYMLVCQLCTMSSSDRTSGHTKFVSLLIPNIYKHKEIASIVQYNLQQISWLASCSVNNLCSFTAAVKEH